MTRHFGPAVALMLTVALGLTVCGPAADTPVTSKKLIKHGWDIPAPTYVADHISQMEKEPFEGVIMRIPPLGSVFVKKKHSRDELDDQFQALQQIQWRKFTDNFLIMYAAADMDWFSDDDWECVLHNVGLLAEAAKLGRCKGICFDAEPYGPNPWHYPSQARADAKSFAEYRQIARQRGAQLLEKIQSHIDSPVIHTFFMMSYLAGLADRDEAARNRILSDHHYGLLPAFFEGMLGVAEPGTIITDGNEGSYYYRRAEQYQAARDLIRDRAWLVLAPQVHHSYKQHVQVSQALYVDHIFDYRKTKYLSHYMTPQERARWFQHNVYHALRTADEYVWLYTEQMNWWKHENLPEGVKGAVTEAKAKLADGRPLGYNMANIIEAAENRRAQQLRAQLTRRETSVSRASRPPTVDGRLDDALWKQVSALYAFVPCLQSKQDAARTLAWVAYDDRNLYLAVYCAEPDMHDLQIVGSQRDAEVWRGDSVDLFITPAEDPVPYYHVILNPRNVRWDAYDGGEQELSWNPDIKTAVFKAGDSWTLEVALPWSAMKATAPPAGTALRANVCRQRKSPNELSCWSQTVRGFVEPDNFGTWRFE